MAKSVDVDIYSDATAKCSNCGSVYTIASAIKELTIEICGNCHPFYTGQDVVVDTAGRIEKFQERLAKTQGMQGAKKLKKQRARKMTQSLADLVEEGEEISKSEKNKPPKSGQSSKKAESHAKENESQNQTLAKNSQSSLEESTPQETEIKVKEVSPEVIAQNPEPKKTIAESVKAETSSEENNAS